MTTALALLALELAHAASPLPTTFTTFFNYTGQHFFDGFMFFSDQADPTDGYVNYVNESYAFQRGLAKLMPDSAVLLRVVYLIVTFMTYASWLSL